MKNMGLCLYITGPKLIKYCPEKILQTSISYVTYTAKQQYVFLNITVIDNSLLIFFMLVRQVLFLDCAKQSLKPALVSTNPNIHLQDNQTCIKGKASFNSQYIDRVQ